MDAPEGLVGVNSSLVVSVLSLAGLLDLLGFVLVNVTVVCGVRVLLGKFSLSLDPVPGLKGMSSGLRSSRSVGGSVLVVLVESSVQPHPAGQAKMSITQDLGETKKPTYLVVSQPTCQNKQKLLVSDLENQQMKVSEASQSHIRASAW